MLLLEAAAPTSLQIFGSEFVGTALLIVLGAGVVANALLPKTKGNAGGPQFINWGWGIAVMVGVFAAYKSGGQLNPAVTLGLWAAGKKELTAGYAMTAGHIAIYIIAQFAGAFVGAFICWLAHKQHYDEDCDPALKLGTFSTGPAIRSYGWNVLTELIGTYVLVIWVLFSGYTMGGNIAGTNVSGTLIGPLGVMFLIVGIGNSLGGPTGYAINPARDLGPRIAYTLMPIKGKGGSDWGYSWVPVVGPIIGGILAGLTANANLFGLFPVA